MSNNKTTGDQKPTIAADNHDQNVGQRGGTRREHAEEPNTGMRVSEGGNKVQGDDLEDIIPGKQPRTKRGAETFDAEGESLERDKSANCGHDEDPEASVDSDRGAETFDISEDVEASDLVDRDEGNLRDDVESDKPPRGRGKR